MVDQEKVLDLRVAYAKKYGIPYDPSGTLEPKGLARLYKQQLARSRRRLKWLEFKLRVIIPVVFFLLHGLPYGLLLLLLAWLLY